MNMKYLWFFVANQFLWVTVWLGFQFELWLVFGFETQIKFVNSGDDFPPNHESKNGESSSRVIGSIFYFKTREGLFIIFWGHFLSITFLWLSVIWWRLGRVNFPETHSLLTNIFLIYSQRTWTKETTHSSWSALGSDSDSRDHKEEIKKGEDEENILYHFNQISRSNNIM